MYLANKYYARWDDKTCQITFLKGTISDRGDGSGNNNTCERNAL